MSEFNRFKISIGDWSSDGHGECVHYIVTTHMHVQDVREAHFKCPEVLGFDIGDIAMEYSDNSVPYHIIEKLVKAGIFDEDWLEDDADHTVDVDGVADIWIRILNHINPALQLVIPPVDENKIPSLHFYGYDEQGRHLNTPGYGCFGDDD